MMMLMVVFVMFVMMFMLATMLMFVMMCHNYFLFILLRCKGTQNVMQLGCKPLLVKVFATELHEISKKTTFDDTVEGRMHLGNERKMNFFIAFRSVFTTFVQKSVEHGHRQICKAA